MKKVRLILSVVIVLGVAAAATSVAVARSTSVDRQALSCKRVVLGSMGPYTGPVASIGTDQLHWAQFYVQRWNRTHKMKVVLVPGDSQLDPSKASIIAQQYASNSKMVALIGPSGSQEVIAAAPILKKANLVYVSGSATRTDLTDGSRAGYFYRVVPKDSDQGATIANYLTGKLGLKSGDSVMDVDNQNAYSNGLSDTVDPLLKAKGIKVDRESIASTATDYSSLVSKIGGNTKVVVLTWQVAANAQLFGQQMRQQGKNAIIFGSDGVFDNTKFTIPGAYVSFFAPDVTTFPQAQSIVKLFKAQYGETGPFGAPTWVATQVLVTAAARACKDGSISRAEMRAQIKKTNLRQTILGTPIKFNKNGDISGAQFHVFHIVSGGKYVTVQ
jgi:ABC-type branched-subunit amino acid transport system substrate-binding protein